MDKGTALKNSKKYAASVKEQFPEINLSLLEKLTDDFCEEDFSG